MHYTPHPIPTDSVELPAAILPVVETLAENTHDVWAEGRMAEGWTYGESLHAQLKKHPSLVPYRRLPESEKEYDRQTATQAIKVLVKLGFTILPPKE
jgi:hypothetical protein